MAIAPLPKCVASGEFTERRGLRNPSTGTASWLRHGIHAALQAMAVDREDDITESWQANAGRWVAAVRGSQIRSRAVATDRAVVAAVARYRPGRALDIGCGEGWLVRRLKSESGCKAIGVDGSPALVAAARQADTGGDYRVLTYDEIVANPARLGGPHDVDLT